MSPKGFVVLLAVTAIAVGAAVVTILVEPSPAPVRFVDQPAFPALRADPDAVAKVVLATPEGTFTLKREDDGRWVAEQRFGYPVDPARVRRLVVALSDMRLIEAKTGQPERYARLEVEDPDAEDAKSRRVRLEAADGSVLAEAIIGKQRHRRTGTEASGTYLRRPDDAGSWLATGSVPIEDQVVDWLDDEIVDLQADRIHRIEIRPHGGKAYAIVRDAPGDEFHLADLAQGETLAEDANLGRLAHALSSARLEDVRPRGEPPWPEAPDGAVITTFDGLELTVELTKIDDEPWARFAAREVEPLVVPQAEGAGPAAAATAADPGGAEAADQPVAGAVAEGEGAAPPQETTAVAEGAGGASAEEPPAAVEPAPDAATLNQRLGDWAFRVSQSFFDRLTTPRSKLLKGSDETS